MSWKSFNSMPHEERMGMLNVSYDDPLHKTLGNLPDGWGLCQSGELGNMKFSGGAWHPLTGGYRKWKPWLVPFADSNFEKPQHRNGENKI